MDIDFSKMKLPPIYKRNGRECYLDPVRQKLIYITPEETVRQRIISYLLNELNVPSEMIHVEEPLSHYNIDTRDRADIIIDKYIEDDDVYAALAVIECKAPDVGFSEKETFQMTGYADRLGCDYCMLSNGAETRCYYYDTKKDKYIKIESLPDYMGMLKKEVTEVPIEPIPPRMTLDEIKKNPKAYTGFDMSAQTSNKILVPAVNLWECLLLT